MLRAILIGLSGWAFVWVAISAISAAATHKPFAQCVVSTRLDCE